MTSHSPLLVAQITDTHLLANPEDSYKGFPTVKSFQAILARIQQLTPQPDVILLTGDLAQDDTPEAYQNLYQGLSPLGIPCYWIPGNHDQFWVPEILNQSPISDLKSFQLGGWQFILLDSSVPGCVWGEINAENLALLETQLQQNPSLPTLIALHHPPISIDCPSMDRIGLQNSEILLELVDKYLQIRLVIFGHIHQEFDQERNGVYYFGTPSTCSQFLPKASEFIFDDRPPGFRLFYLYPDGTWTTQVERVIVPFNPVASLSE